MKILILTDDFPPQSFGGAGDSTFYLALGLKRAGHQVSVITVCQHKSDEAKLDYQGLEIFRIFADYHERWRAYLSLYNPQTVGRVKKIISEVKPDVVHANNIHAYLSYYCLKIAKQHSKAVFLTARDVMSFSYGKLATKHYLERFDCRTTWLDHLKQAKKRYNPLRNILIRKYLKHANKIFAVSYALKNALEVNGIRNVEVSHTGVDVADWQISPEKVAEFREKYNLSGKKVIFFGGRISGLKGSEQVEKAVALVKKEVPEAILFTAGSEGVGWLQGEELRAAYHSADVVIVPSVCFDSFPRSNLEAMACGKPVVATCFGGSPEIVQEGITGYIVNPLNIGLMAGRIIDLLKNREKAIKFGQAGYERVKKQFSLTGQIVQTLGWYQKILAENN